jgi:hypothetical protein
MTTWADDYQLSGGWANVPRVPAGSKAGGQFKGGGGGGGGGLQETDTTHSVENAENASQKDYDKAKTASAKATYHKGSASEGAALHRAAAKAHAEIGNHDVAELHSQLAKSMLPAGEHTTNNIDWYTKPSATAPAKGLTGKTPKVAKKTGLENLSAKQLREMANNPGTDAVAAKRLHAEANKRDKAEAKKPGSSGASAPAPAAKAQLTAGQKAAMTRKANLAAKSKPKP